MFGFMNSLNVVICEDGEDALQKGHFYGEDVTRVNIEKVVVVRRGTQEGNPTVDFVMVDEKDNRSIVALTGRLLRTVPCWDEINSEDALRIRPGEVDPS